MFKVGDIVVYPAHGVSEVEAIETREISGSKISFFILKVLDTEMTVMVPVTTRIEDHYHLPARAEIEKLITPKTRAILFSNPNNPTGTILTEDEMNLIRDIALAHDTKLRTRLVPTFEEFRTRFGRTPKLLAEVLAGCPAPLDPACVCEVHAALRESAGGGVATGASA